MCIYHDDNVRVWPSTSLWLISAAPRPPRRSSMEQAAARKHWHFAAFDVSAASNLMSFGGLGQGKICWLPMKLSYMPISATGGHFSEGEKRLC